MYRAGNAGLDIAGRCYSVPTVIGIFCFALVLVLCCLITCCCYMGKCRRKQPAIANSNIELAKRMTVNDSANKRSPGIGKKPASANTLQPTAAKKTREITESVAAMRRAGVTAKKEEHREEEKENPPQRAIPTRPPPPDKPAHFLPQASEALVEPASAIIHFHCRLRKSGKIEISVARDCAFVIVHVCVCFCVLIHIYTLASTQQASSNPK